MWRETAKRTEHHETEASQKAKEVIKKILTKLFGAPAPVTKGSQSEILRALRYRCDVQWDDCADIYLEPRRAYYYFEHVSPLQSTIKRIAQTVANLPLAITDADQGDLDPDHEIIGILTQDPYGFGRDNLLCEMGISYLLTDEAWLMLRGRVTAPPVSISYFRPYEVGYERLATNPYYPDIIRAQPAGVSTEMDFYAVKVEGVIRYFDEPDPKAALNELVPVVGVKSKNRQFRGLSRLMSLQRALNQIISGDIYNAKLLKGGVKPWMVLSPKESLTELEQQDLERSLEAIQGVENVGGMFILPSSMDDISRPTTHRDLEYGNLIQEVKQRIADAYYMPLPLISPDNMTYSNYSTAQVAFFDGPINNLVANLFPPIVKALSRRMGLDDDLRMTYNEHYVPALQVRQAERLKMLHATETLTLNESRQIIGYPDVPQGDEIYMTANKIPVGDTGQMGDDY